MAELNSLLTIIKEMNRRILALEAVYQAKTLQFGGILLDAANDRMVVSSSGVNRVLIDAANGRIKVSKPTKNVLTAADLDMAFNSDYSMFREVQMQTNAEQRFTDSVTYDAYNDCQIKINFADWEDTNMYFECVMKTGAGTGYMRLYNMTNSAELSGSEISTTSTSTVSVRSSAITKLTGTKDFREEQKIVGGGAAYTDIYIGRVIFRYDFT